MSETKEQTTDEGGEDLAIVIAQLRAELAAERTEKEKVKTKNRELLSEKQTAKQAADAAELDAAEKSGNIEALKASHATQLQKLQAKYDALDSELRTVRVDNEITKALNDSNVRSEMSEALTALFKNKVEYADGVATIDGKTIGEFAGEYLGSAVGAHFVRPADNSGGGATGSASKAAKVQLDKPFSLTEYGALKASDPVAAAAWATQSGNGYLNDLN